MIGGLTHFGSLPKNWDPSENWDRNMQGLGLTRHELNHPRDLNGD